MSISDTQQQPARSVRGSVPMTRFLLNGEALDVNVTSASVVATDGKHDEAKISVTSPTLETTDGLVDQPISFYWGASPHAETFSGYVMQVEPDSQGASGALTFTMTVFGATKAMFEGTPQFWQNKSIPSAVRDLASKNRLGFYGHPHTYLWGALTQTSETDWAVVNDLTKRLGWRLWSRYGCLLCYDPLVLFRESGSYCRLMMGTPEDVTTDRHLLDFTPTELSATDTALLGRKYGYFTASSAVQIAVQPGEYKGYQFTTDVVIESPDAATAYLDAGVNDLDSWSQSALARIWGDADLYPGMCVEVVTTNRRYLKAQYDGKWLIRGTSHQMDRQQYQTMLYLVRPDSKTPVGVQPYVPFWRQTDVSSGKPFLSLNDGQWVSSKAAAPIPGGV